MADDTTTTTGAELAAAEKRINPPVVTKDEPAAISLDPGTTPPGWMSPPEPMPAVDRLRAFEDDKLGKDAPRFAGALERGSGSLWERLSEADKAMHAKLEKLVKAEEKLASAHSALIAADVEHDAALAAVEKHDG